VKVRFVTQIEITVDVSELLELDDSLIDDDLAISAATSEANDYLQTLHGDGHQVTVAHLGVDALQEAEVVR
jgi:hypothetical protein